MSDLSLYRGWIYQMQRYVSAKRFPKLLKLFPRNSKITAVLSISLLKCDKSTLKLPLSWLQERHLGYDVL